MPKFEVDITITGGYTTEVEADTADEAVELAFAEAKGKKVEDLIELDYSIESCACEEIEEEEEVEEEEEPESIDGAEVIDPESADLSDEA